MVLVWDAAALKRLRDPRVTPGSQQWRLLYEAYLASAEWQVTRARFYAETGERSCRACGSASRVELHHRTYERLGRERHVDFAPLCRPCHAAVHRIAKHRRDLSLAQVTDLICAG